MKSDSKKATAQKIQNLKEQIQRHDHLYYNLDQPEITDFEYDQLFKKLKDLEGRFPEFQTEDSPTQKIPGQALEKFDKAPHSLPMLSLQNSYSKQEITAFYHRTLKLLKQKELTCFVEPKLDGTAIELIYENRILSKALSRGDGQIGEDITKNVKTIKGLPLRLPGKTSSSEEILEFRGEILIFKKNFEQINRERAEEGLSLFANPRNLAAGSLRQLDPKLTASRPLCCFIHSPGLMQPSSITTQEEFIERLPDLRLPSFQICRSKKHADKPTNKLTGIKKGAKNRKQEPLKFSKKSFSLCRLTHSLKEILDYYEELALLRPKLPFEIDGMVIKINRFEEQKSLGAIARSPRWAMAGKFSPEEKTTQVLDIRLQLGRTGVLTPVAELKAVSIGGVCVRQARLHNFKELARKDIRIGDWVLVHRAGDVIPEVIKAFKEKRQEKGQEKGQEKNAPFLPPKNCPICKSELSQAGDYLICSNPSCPGVMESRFIHFASKKALNIESLGKKSMKKFYSWGWLNCYSDIYSLPERPLLEKEGFGEKSRKLLILNLKKSLNTELSRLIFGLGIPLIGERAGQKISDKIYEIFGSEKELSLRKAISLMEKISLSELEEIEDMGPLSAQSFRQAFAHPDLIQDLIQLAEKGMRLFKGPQGLDTGDKTKASLKGLSFVITGTFPESRDKIKRRILLHGGKVLSQVSKKTDFLLEGEKPGSKKKKAEKLKIKVLLWEDFLNKIQKK